LIGYGRQTGNHGETHRRWTPAVRPPRMLPKGLTIAKTVVKVSVVTDTADGKKSVARRSTGSTIPLHRLALAVSASDIHDSSV
jgi:hypothetical protein